MVNAIAGDGQEGKAFKLGIGAAAGNGVFVEHIDVRLDNDIGKGDNGILNTGGQPVANDLAQHGSLDAQTAEAEAVVLAALCQSDNTQHGAQKL